MPTNLPLYRSRLVSQALDYLFHFTLPSSPDTGNGKSMSASYSSTYYFAHSIQAPRTNPHISSSNPIQLKSYFSRYFPTIAHGSPAVQDPPSTSPHKNGWNMVYSLDANVAEQKTPLTKMSV